MLSVLHSTGLAVHWRIIDIIVNLHSASFSWGLHKRSSLQQKQPGTAKITAVHRMCDLSLVAFVALQVLCSCICFFCNVIWYVCGMALAMKHIKRIDHLYHTGNSFQQNCADLQFLLFFCFFDSAASKTNTCFAVSSLPYTQEVKLDAIHLSSIAFSKREQSLFSSCKRCRK